MNLKSYHLPKSMVRLMLLLFLASGTMRGQGMVLKTLSDPTQFLQDVNLLNVSDDNAILVFSPTLMPREEKNFYLPYFFFKLPDFPLKNNISKNNLDSVNTNNKIIFNFRASIQNSC